MLIRDCGAKLVTGFQDVLSEFDFLPGLSPQGGAVTVPAAADEPLKLFNEAEETIYHDLSVNGPGSLDDLSVRTKLPAGVLAGTLMAMEIRDLIVKSPNNVYSLK